MLETIAAKAPAAVFYIIAAITSILGLLLIWLPMLGLPLLGLGFFSYILAGKAGRKAREIQVRRQQGD